MGPVVELVGVVRLTRLWAEDVRLQAVLTPHDCGCWPGWLHLTVRLHQYTLGSSQTTIATPVNTVKLEATTTLAGKLAKKSCNVVVKNNLTK